MFWCFLGFIAHRASEGSLSKGWSNETSSSHTKKFSEKEIVFYDIVQIVYSKAFESPLKSNYKNSWKFAKS